MAKLPSWLGYLGAFALGGATAGSFVWWDAHQLHPHYFKIPDGLGHLLSGIGTCVGVIGGAIGYGSWARRRKKERLASLATETLLTAFEISKVLWRAAIGYGPPDGPPNERRHEIWELFHDPELEEKVRKTRLLVEALMDKEAVAAIQPLWDRFWRTDGAIAVSLANAAEQDNLEFFGDAATKAITAELERIKRHFREYALLDSVQK